MHIVTLIALGFSVVFTLLAVLGLINPRLGLCKSKEASLLRNGGIALIAYMVMAISISANDPRQDMAGFMPHPPSSPAPAAGPVSPGAAPSR